MKIDLHEMALQVRNLIAQAPEKCQTRGDLNIGLGTTSNAKRQEALNEVLASMLQYKHLNKQFDAESTIVVFWLPEDPPGGMMADTIRPKDDLHDWLRNPPKQPKVQVKVEQPAVERKSEPESEPELKPEDVSAQLDAALKAQDERRQARKLVKGSAAREALMDRLKELALEFVNKSVGLVSSADLLAKIPEFADLSPKSAGRLLNTLYRHKKIEHIRKGGVNLYRKVYSKVEDVAADDEALAADTVEETEVDTDAEVDEYLDQGVELTTTSMDTALDITGTLPVRTNGGRRASDRAIREVGNEPNAYLDSTGKLALDSYGETHCFDHKETKAILSLLSHIASLSRLSQELTA